MNAVTRSVTWPRSSFVGFDRIWNELDAALTSGVEHSPNFPRHNIVKTDEESYTIEIALAGYSRDDLEVELKDGYLIISGEKNDEGVDYLHKGISNKKFRRTFRLAENVIVKDVNFVDGLLMVDLSVVIPEEKKPQTLDIGTKKKALPSS